ncbi:MAG TPA: alkaline phosphatase family protein [Solirubrobacterales bacterium]
MKGWLATRIQAAIGAAASLTGKRFGLLVASSLVATSAIVAAGMSSGGRDLGPLAALVGRSLAAERTVAEAPVAAPEPAPEVEAEPEASPRPVASEPEPAPLVEPAPEPAAAEEAAPEPEPEEAAPPPKEEAKPEAGRVKHVFVISLASPGYEAAFGPGSVQMPYLAETLRPQGDLLSGFTLLRESWLANSFASIAGQKPIAESEKDCPEYEKCIFPVETMSFADQLATAQFSWRGYFEGMVDATGKPANCVHPEPGASEAAAPGGYSAVLNPFVYFHTLLDLGECAANDVPLTELEKDLRKATKTPNFSYISPDLCNAGVVPGQCAEGAADGAAAADAWLSTWVPKILESPAYKADGLVIVTFGAVNPVPNPDPTQPPTPATSLKTGTLLLSPFLTPGSSDAARYDPYSLLATGEDLFGLNRLGEAGGKKVRSLAPQLLEEENGGD